MNFDNIYRYSYNRKELNIKKNSKQKYNNKREKVLII